MPFDVDQSVDMQGWSFFGLLKWFEKLSLFLSDWPSICLSCAELRIQSEAITRESHSDSIKDKLREWYPRCCAFSTVRATVETVADDWTVPNWRTYLTVAEFLSLSPLTVVIIMIEQEQRKIDAPALVSAEFDWLRRIPRSWKNHLFEVVLIVYLKWFVRSATNCWFCSVSSITIWNRRARAYRYRKLCLSMDVMIRIGPLQIKQDCIEGNSISNKLS